MDIRYSARDGAIVLSLIGALDATAAPMVQRTLLRHLAEQPDTVICELSRLESLDPGCATVFAAVAHRPRNRWPDSRVVLSGARPAVAAVLRRLRGPHRLPSFADLDQAIAHARSRAPFLRERLRLVPALEAIGTARWFAAEVCRRWRLDEPAEEVQLLAGALVADAVVHRRSSLAPVELRLELRATGLLVGVHAREAGLRSTGIALDPDQARSDPEAVQRVAEAWGARTQSDGSRIVWCVVPRTI